MEDLCDGELDRNATEFYDEGHIAFKYYTFQIIMHPIALVICVPMNLIVAYVLISDRRLHNARNSIWLGIITSNLVVFSMISLQYFIFIEPNYTVCQVDSLMVGKPYFILLINILLATCDRIIYTKWPLFHRRHVTVSRVVACQLVCSTVAFIGLNFPFLTGIKPIQCGWDPPNDKLTIGAIAVLNFTCIVAKLVVYFMATRSSIARQHGIVIKRLKVIEQNSDQTDGETPSLRIHCGSQKMRLMEWNVTMTLVASLIPMTLFTSLSYLYMLSQLLCRNFFGSCETLNQLEIYFHEFGIFHVGTDLLGYVFRSVEFKSAVQKLFRVCQKPQPENIELYN